MIGKLEHVPLREIWRHEARDFSSWLFENCDVLSDQIGISIAPLEKEKSVGPFNVDIWAEDLNGGTVIIENQLEKTDHDHLGKLFTYMSNLDAKIGIWISSHPRNEHRTAITYLNEIAPADTAFYLVKLEAYRIGESQPAPLFTVEAGPSDESSARGKVKKEHAERDKLTFDFFTKLLEKTNLEISTFRNVSPVIGQNWVNAGSGKADILWDMSATKKDTKVFLHLCSSDADTNRENFDALQNWSQEIESQFGGNLTWDYNASRKRQFIRSISDVGGLDNTIDWPKIHKDMTDRMTRLINAIEPYLKIL